MLRLVNQFDSPRARASVSTPTCCSCCCCCCIISTIANGKILANAVNRSLTGKFAEVETSPVEQASLRGELKALSYAMVPVLFVSIVVTFLIQNPAPAIIGAMFYMYAWCVLVIRGRLKWTTAVGLILLWLSMLIADAVAEGFGFLYLAESHFF